MDAGSSAGFEISSAGVAYASLKVGGVTSIYTVNLTSGVATLIGPVGSGATPLQGLTIVP